MSDFNDGRKGVIYSLLPDGDGLKAVPRNIADLIFEPVGSIMSMEELRKDPILQAKLREEESRVNKLVTGDPNKKPSYKELWNYILNEDEQKKAMRPISYPNVIPLDNKPLIVIDSMSQVDEISRVSSFKINLPPSVRIRPAIVGEIPPIHSHYQKRMTEAASMLARALRPLAMSMRPSPWVTSLWPREKRRDKTALAKVNEGYVLQAAHGPAKHGDRNATQFVKKVKPHPLLKGLIQKTEK